MIEITRERLEELFTDVEIEAMIDKDKFVESFDYVQDDLVYTITDKAIEEMHEFINGGSWNRVQLLRRMYEDTGDWYGSVVSLGRQLKHTYGYNLFYDVWIYKDRLGIKISHEKDWLSCFDDV